MEMSQYVSVALKRATSSLFSTSAYRYNHISSQEYLFSLVYLAPCIRLCNKRQHRNIQKCLCNTRLVRQFIAVVVTITTQFFFKSLIYSGHIDYHTSRSIFSFLHIVIWFPFFPIVLVLLFYNQSYHSHLYNTECLVSISISDKSRTAIYL